MKACTMGNKACDNKVSLFKAQKNVARFQKWLKLIPWQTKLFHETQLRVKNT